MTVNDIFKVLRNKTINHKFYNKKINLSRIRLLNKSVFCLTRHSEGKILDCNQVTPGINTNQHKTTKEYWER